MYSLNRKLFLAVFGVFGFVETAFGAGALNIYSSIGPSLGLDSSWNPVLSTLLASLVLFLVGSKFKSYANAYTGEMTPKTNVGIGSIIEIIMDFVWSLGKEQIGHHFKAFYPLLSTIMIYIFIVNLTGLVPGFPPATENISTTLAFGLVVFIIYNLAGLKELGLGGYLAHFLGPFTKGPMILLGLLFAMIEVLSHSARPFSLAIRLTLNIFGDHLLLGVFSNLIPAVVPSLLMFFGLLVAFVQSFVFTLLTGIYIGMATSHDH